MILQAAKLVGAGSATIGLAGAGVGILGTGAKYEYDKKREMDQLDRDFKRGNMSKEEYLERKEQIEKGSAVH